MFVIYLGDSLGLMDNYYLHTFLAIALSLFSLYFIVTSLFGDIETSSRIYIALLLQSVWLAAAIELRETLYWFAGVNYYWTCSVLLIEFALIVNIYKGKNEKIYACLLGVLVFLNSGASELSAVYQVPMFAGAALITALSGSFKCSKYMLVMLCIALAGLGLQVTAPGNAVRIAAEGVTGSSGPNMAPVTRNFFVTYKVGVISGLISSYHFFTRPIIYALLLFLPVVSDRVKQPNLADKMPFGIKIWHMCLFQIVTACCFQAIGGYSTGSALHLRVMSVVRFIMLAQWILFFIFLYRNSKFTEWIRNTRVYRYKEVILLLCLLMSTNFSLLISDYRLAPEYSRQLTERREFIKQQSALGNKNLVVPTITVNPRLFMKDVILPKIAFQSNDYLYYYGLNSIEEENPSIIEAMVEGRNSDDEELEAIGGYEEARIKAIKLEAERGLEYARFLLARYYDTSDFLTSPYIQKNDKLALEYYFKLADQGHKQSRDLLWTFYMGGLRTERDSDVILWGLKSILNPF
jgi:hypothetical protein